MDEKYPSKKGCPATRIPLVAKECAGSKISVFFWENESIFTRHRIPFIFWP